MTMLRIVLAAVAVMTTVHASDDQPATAAEDPVVQACAEGGCPIATAFIDHDSDHDLHLTRAELTAAMNKKAAGKIIGWCDADDDQQVSLEEYKALIAKMREQQEKKPS